MINKLRAWLDYKARCEAMAVEHERLTKDFDGLKWRQSKLEIAYNMSGQENNSLKAQLEKVKTERDALQLKLDEALRPKVPAVDGAVKKPRVSRAKPQGKEEV